ncbi:hypothetical protein BJX61DRAFT_320902 [Aspergillus egyptiacus]|nr:hypothetical protein BJX61DRAFT_320902 [Aspergillus egyptiacus]
MVRQEGAMPSWLLLRPPNGPVVSNFSSFPQPAQKLRRQKLHRSPSLKHLALPQDVYHQLTPFLGEYSRVTATALEDRVSAMWSVILASIFPATEYAIEAQSRPREYTSQG